MDEHHNKTTFKGNPLTLIGNELTGGQAAPDAALLANDLTEVNLSAYRGKVCVISVVPSLDTPVCDAQTRRFNEEATALGDDVAVLTVSMDPPFAQTRWCGAAGVEAVQTVSDHRDAALATAYGVLIKELRLLARAVFVIDRDRTVQHAQVVGEVTEEPDYAAILDAVGSLT